MSGARLEKSVSETWNASVRSAPASVETMPPRLKIDISAAKSKAEIAATDAAAYLHCVIQIAKTTIYLVRLTVHDRTQPPELVPQAQWLKEVLDVDPAALLRGTKASVLLAYGDKDLEVNVGDAVGRLRQAAVDAGTPVKVQRFEDLDHLFKVEEKERSTPASYRERRSVDPAFLRALVAWAQARVR